MVKGYYFTLHYNIKLDKNEDVVEYQLSNPKLIKLEIEDDGIAGDFDDEWCVFSNNDLYDCNGIMAYVNKHNENYEYLPNEHFDYYEYISWDIDDFGDCHEGWNQYRKACMSENERYENSLHKISYECFVVGTNEIDLKVALDDIINEFCKENEVNKEEK